MKTLTKVFGLAAGIAALGTFASCSNDVNDPDLPTTPQSNSVLVHAPTVSAWSGDENFGSTRGTRSGEEVAAPAPVSDDEIAAAKAYFDAKENGTPTNGGTDITIDDLAEWTNYYVQDVANGNRFPSDKAVLWGDTNSETISNVAVWNIAPEEVVKIINTPEYADNDAKVLLNLEGAQLVTGHTIRDFSWETEGYDSWNTKYEVISCGHTGQYDWAPNYRLATLGNENEVYVALFGYTNQNNGAWDRIIKITKVDLPDAPEVDEPVGDEIVSDKILHNHEVEVNLSVMDTHEAYYDEDLVTKLSIHVRNASDVKVRIPVPFENLVQKDDLDIAIKHPEMIFGEEHHASFDIDGNTVELFVQFVEAEDCAGHQYGYYIEVSTKGINKAVIDYCMAQHQDGVNFEIFNYYQWNTVLEDGTIVRHSPTSEDINKLKEEWLDKTTVEFGYDNGRWNAYTATSDYPYYYINAFGNNLENGNGWKDCTVKVISNQDYAFENYFVGPHLNGSDLNVIYVREDIYGSDRQDDAHVQHNIPPVPTY